MSTNPKNQKLELTWIGKGDEPKLEPRILIENPEYSYGDPESENMLIHGDNLLALKALEQDYAGKVKCIYIDPPYNTGSAFEHYDDGIEHSLWLNLIKVRLEILWNLLDSKTGSIWISIDDREMAYLKVLLDEIYGRDKFIASNVWQKRYSRENRSAIGDSHEYIIVYSKNPDSFKANRNKVKIDEKQKKLYKNPDNDPNGPWQSVSLTAQGYRSNQMYSIEAPNGKIHYPPKERCWGLLEDKYLQLKKERRITFGATGEGVPRIKMYLKDAEGLVPWTWWTHEEVGHTDEAKKEQHFIFGKENSFDTPKPERLIERIFHIATNKGDLVLDSFLGSGTTVAVAHKMGRKWIGVELGDHAVTHCVPRLKQVVDGEQGGISKWLDWKGGGGFKFYTLAPSLLNKDKFGNWVINKEYNPDMLAAAMAKQEGFRYAPNEQVYWKQGRSTEKDFIFTTTRFLTVESLDKIREEMRDEESLLICSKVFQPECENRHTNITIRKIPSLLLGKCEFGKDDYSLNIINLPEELRPIPDESDHLENLDQEESDASEKSTTSPSSTNQQSLF